MDFQTQSKITATILLQKFLTSEDVKFFDKHVDNFHVINGRWASEASEEERSAPNSELHTVEQEWVETSNPNYYSMVGVGSAPTPTYYFRKEVVDGVVVEETTTTTDNPELWCFYPDFETEILKLASKSNKYLFASGYTARQVDKIRSFAASNQEVA